MEEDEKKETIKVKPLNETIRSFVEWKKAIDDALRTQAKFLRVVVYTIDGKDEVLNENLAASSTASAEGVLRFPGLALSVEWRSMAAQLVPTHRGATR